MSDLISTNKLKSQLSDEFTEPDFMKNQSVKDILSNMLSTLPDSISKEENGWVCDLFSPVAIEHSKAIQFILMEALKNIIPKYSYGEILIGHAENRGLRKREASYAQVILTVKGIVGTVIPKDFKFSTVSTLYSSGIVFSTNYEVKIPEMEPVSQKNAVSEINIPATCSVKGNIGNVAAETVILMVKPLKGIKSCGNEKPAYGGFEEESEESLRKRILEYDLKQGSSFVGSSSDYRRWALEIEGVGNARIISAQDDTGLVKIVLTDSNGFPAGDEVCTNVYNHIMRPDAPYERLAPVNALLGVIPATAYYVKVSAVLKLEENVAIEDVKNSFAENFRQYLKTAEAHKEVKYAETGSILINIEGVLDYSKLSLNGSTENLIIEIDMVPVVKIGDIAFLCSENGGDSL